MSSDLVEPTSWIFPPALNATFISDFNYLTAQYNSSESSSPSSHDILLESVRNLTYSDRLATGFDEGFGRDGVILQVGDTITPAWSGGGNRTMRLLCYVCSQGQGRNEAGDGVFAACGNYTESKYITMFPDETPASAPEPYTIPPLSKYVQLSESACAICMLALSSPDLMSSHDYSVPFPVLQNDRFPHYAFNTSHPTGIADPKILGDGEYDKNSLTEPSDPAEESGHDWSKGAVIGLMLGIVGGIAVLGALFVCIWRRRRAKFKRVASGNSSTIGQPASVGTQNVNLEMQRMQAQRVQSVVRRPDTSASEAPPTYLEAMRDRIAQ